MKTVLAYDFGASSGRAIAAWVENGKLKTEEIHRFLNEPVTVNGTFYWDILRLFHEIKQGIVKAKKAGFEIESLAIDTWGVDFGLLDKKGDLLANPVHYRDKRNECFEELFDIIPKEELYGSTGIQFMNFNTVFQLYALKKYDPELLERADKLLFTPDLLNYFLTGNAVTEYTIASTGALLDAKSGEWDFSLTDKMGIKRSLFTKIVKPGTEVGYLRKEICEELNVKPFKIFTSPSHDTAAAVLSVPTEEKDFAFLSCGTWSLLGTELDAPLINEETFAENFTNEGGAFGTIRLLKNIIGLWIAQECRRSWQKDGEVSLKELDEAALASKPLVSFINPSDPTFLPPGKMPERIVEYCKKTGQEPPKDKGAMSRCISESLALDYSRTILRLEKLTKKEYNSINVVGGGIKDRLLMQFTADATGKKVVAGPAEATASGNIVMQLIALGEIKNRAEARRIIKNSGGITEYLPKDPEKWAEAKKRFEMIAKENN